MRPSPAVTLVRPSLLVIDRSALVATVSVSLVLLLAVFGSLVLLVTVAVSVWVPGSVEAGTVKLMVNVALAPETSEPTVHTLPLKLPLLGEDDPSVRPAGQTSVTDTLCASDRPLLCTVIV